MGALELVLTNAGTAAAVATGLVTLPSSLVVQVHMLTVIS